jgi:PKD repeat protein
MRSRIVIIVLFAFSVALNAATINVPSMSQSNMIWCAANAQDGDTFIFPAGSATYTNTSPAGSFVDWCVKWTNAVTLQFTPGQSIIQNASGDGYSFVFTFETSSGGKPLRISGLTIDGLQGSSGIVIWGGQKNVRVTQCVFNNCVHTGLKWWGQEAYGVTDHCSFTNCEQAIVVYGDDNSSWSTTEGWAYGMGTTNGVYVEDCNIVYDTNSGWLGTSPLPIENGHGARAAYRHNTFLSFSPANLAFFDSHGNQLLYPGNHRGTVWTVLENNTFYVLNTYLYNYIRGGTLIMISNVMNGADAVGVSLTEEEGWRKDLFEPLRVVWPAQDQITNSWFVNNYVNGKLVDASIITNNVRSPIGSVAYGYALSWSDLLFIQEGRDFVVTNNVPPAFGYNHPRIPGGAYGYTPLPYPHPLVRAIKSQSRPPVVFAQALPRSGSAPLAVSFSTAGTYNPNGTILTYFWNFGDGNLATVANPSHTFATNGTFKVQLLVSDGLNTIKTNLTVTATQ